MLLYIQYSAPASFLIFQTFFSISIFQMPQVLRYFDYVFTGVFTFEMIIKVCP